MKKNYPFKKKSLDDYIENNDLNSRIYEILLKLQDAHPNCRHKLKKTPIEIFNEAYAICEELKQEKHPEEMVHELWEREQPKSLLCEANIIFSCVYVILLFSKNKNPNIKFFLSRIKQKIAVGFFQEFEPLIREELMHITEKTDSFDLLKREANRITDLDKRELFYIDVFMHYQQAKNQKKTSSALQKISNEIDFIERIRALLSNVKKQDCKTAEISKKESPNDAYIKVKTVAILELLKEMKLGAAYNDRTKISKLIAFLTGNSPKKIYNEMQKGITLTKYHNQQIEEINKIFKELNIRISICKDNQY
jgi:hypothetical protein